MVDKRVSKIGAAAFALGMSLTGPQCAGVAAAAGPDSDASVVPAASDDQSAKPASARPGRGHRGAVTSSTATAPSPRQPRQAAAARGAAPTPTDTVRARRSAGLGSTTPSAGISDLRLPATRPVSRARPVAPAAALAQVIAPATPNPPAAARRTTGRTGCPACWGGAAAGPEAVP